MGHWLVVKYINYYYNKNAEGSDELPSAFSDILFNSTALLV